ncbi:MAG: hypothetical protein GWN18_16645, partial [Thermoplasmata archaeon]|nr:hypothetical protein [Thermoplasmata archaeon]NIS13708.1 hypothetical protein [Thermoplasmata archaeon]NIS21578.1 hypothetical protein [Thermoplasmata archaeon]NIT79152.1 hypothetical protein [Thermoplasmata archaeon]NIU50617.1 hypothetical protein [Thermoplasmata archaeon]
DGSDVSATTGREFTFRTTVSDNIDISGVRVSYRFGGEEATNMSLTLESVQGPDQYVYSLSIVIPVVIPG